MEELGHPTHTVIFMRDGRGHPTRNVMFLRDGRGHSRHKVMAFERRSSIGPRWNRIVYNYNKKQRTKLLFCTVYCTLIKKYILSTYRLVSLVGRTAELSTVKG